MFNRKYLIYKLKSNSYESDIYFSFIKYVLKLSSIYAIFLKIKKKIQKFNNICFIENISFTSLNLIHMSQIFIFH